MSGNRAVHNYIIEPGTITCLAVYSANNGLEQNFSPLRRYMPDSLIASIPATGLLGFFNLNALCSRSDSDRAK
jgi:hypothetical protein